MAFPITVPITAIDRLSNPLGRISSKLGRFGRDVKQVGKNLTLGLTLPILGLGAAVIKTSASFQSEMNNVRVLTGAVGEDFQNLRNRARELGSTTQFTAQQAAEGQSLLAKAGFNADQILQGLNDTLNLAAAGELSMGEAADIAATTMKGFRLEATEIGRVSDTLTTGFTKVNTTIGGLAAGMAKVGSVARGLGFDFEETAATIALMQDSGAKAELAGTALRGVFGKIIKGAPEFAKAAKQLKLKKSDFFEGNGQLRSMLELLESLERVGADSGDVLRLFGTEAGPAFAGLLGGGSKALKELTQLMKKDTGSAARVAAVRMEGATGAMKELASAATDLLIEIGDSGLLKVFTGLVVQLTDFTKKLGKTSPATLKVATGLLAVAAAVGPVLVGFGALITSITGLISSVGLFGPALVKLATTLFTVVIPAIFSFTVALATNPVFLIISAIVALIAIIILLATHWEETVAAWELGWAVMRFQAFSVINSIKAEIRSLIDLMPEWLLGLINVANPLGGLAIQKLDEFANTPTLIDGQGKAGTAAEIALKAMQLKIIFDKVPPGVNIDSSDLGDDVELETGFAMAGI